MDLTKQCTVPPCYGDQLANTIGVLQKLQRLFSDTATLADVHCLVTTMMQQHGADTQLEQVIQALVGRHLALQVTFRRERQAVTTQEESAHA